MLKQAGAIVINKTIGVNITIPPFLFVAYLIGYKFCHAASCGNLPEIKTLVLSGADINTGDYDGRTALHIAASTGNLELVKYIVANGRIQFHSLFSSLFLGGIRHVMDRFGGCPVDDAKRNGHREVVDYLMATDNFVEEV